MLLSKAVNSRLLFVFNHCVQFHLVSKLNDSNAQYFVFLFEQIIAFKNVSNLSLTKSSSRMRYLTKNFVSDDMFWLNPVGECSGADDFCDCCGTLIRFRSSTSTIQQHHPNFGFSM